MEEWKDIKGYEGLYQVSNEGRVRSLDRYVNGRNCQVLRKGRIRKFKIDKKGYLLVCLSISNIEKTYKVNRLVAEAFIENPDNLPCTNHKNCIPSDNRVENLEWCDYTYNNHYGGRIDKARQKMINNPRISKVVYKYTLDGKFIGKYPSANEAQRDMGIDKSKGVSMCCRGIIPSYKGYRWSYKPL